MPDYSVDSETNRTSSWLQTERSKKRQTDQRADRRMKGKTYGWKSRQRDRVIEDRQKERAIDR